MLLNFLHANVTITHDLWDLRRCFLSQLFSLNLISEIVPIDNFGGTSSLCHLKDKDQIKRRNQDSASQGSSLQPYNNEGSRKQFNMQNAVLGYAQIEQSPTKSLPFYP